MLSRRRILIVDSSPDNREVLRTLLERSGAQTWETARIRHACNLAQSAAPDVIVLDGGAGGRTSGAALGELCRHAERTDTPIVVLGTPRQVPSRWDATHFVSKPYHYAAVIRRIEELLGNRV